MNESNGIEITARPETDPAICEFTVNREIVAGNAHCSGRAQAKGAPLFEALFELDGISEVFVMGSRLRVRQLDEEPYEPWSELAKKVGQALRQSFQQSSSPIPQSWLDARNRPTSMGEGESEAEVIKRVLDEKINPALSSHGGHAALVKVDNHVAYVELSGGCQGCASSKMTLKHGIEKLIRESVPSIVHVEDVTEHEAGENPYYR